MFEKLGALFSLFRKGSEVSNVELWKTGGISVGALAAFIGALVTFGDAFGLHIPITPDQINGIATGVIAVVGVVLPIITSKRAGILPAKPGQPAPIEDHSFGPGMSANAAPASAAVLSESGATTNLVTDPDPLAGLDTTFHG